VVVAVAIAVVIVVASIPVEVEAPFRAPEFPWAPVVQRRRAKAGLGLGGTRRQPQTSAHQHRRCKPYDSSFHDYFHAPGDALGRGSRTRVFSWLARRFSIDAVLPYPERAERADAGMYQHDPEATSDMAVSERSHARVLTQLRGATVTIGMCCAAANHGTAATDVAIIFTGMRALATGPTEMGNFAIAG
jgi:hypothetical protein